MKTAGQKRRGRPRKEGVDREPNGQARRGKGPRRMPAEAADALTLAVRARHAGITLAEAKDQKAGTFIGILRIRGQRDERDPSGISEHQYNALNAYGELHANWLRAIAAPGEGVAGEGSGGGPEISHRYVAWCSKIKEAHARARDAIMMEQMGNRTDNILGALDVCVHRDMREWHLVPSLKIAANVLLRHFERA